MLVLLNFRNKTASAKTDIDMSRARLVIGNYPDAPKAAELRPYEAAVYEW
jgi:oligo-1,6-glucosidase